MPAGSPNKQTIASEKYHKRIGVSNHSFKIKDEVAVNFREACAKAGVSQASKITELMLKFIDEVNAENQ